jgi:hypothetical protein
MTRATLKVSHETASRLAGAKRAISVDADRNLNTGQAIDYLLVHWAITRGQRHLIEFGADGVPYSPSNATA